ncbi:TonB-dependent receptor [Cupriavidus gilardii]|uniref:TonB-dependent receptor n=1 Tax=Cupriavidus gilardii TaxID=82541 RepID=UPI001ABDE94A|nr:TonB-dependent receptor [Cupriavidus gilardii]MBO4123121.1 TonB-dependent receptor [Cupriavidus gilardii]
MGHLLGHVAAPERQPTHRFRRKLLARAARHIAFGAALAAPALLVPVAHAQPAATRSYDIPAGTLEDALSRFGREAGIMLSFKPELTAGRTSGGLKGSYTVRRGLDTLLANSGLAAVEQSNGTYVVNAAPRSADAADGVATLPTATVVAAADDGGLPAPYAGGQVARGGGLGVLGTADVMDVPFSTTNYTAEMLQDTQARTLADVVVNEASVRTLTSSGGFGEDFQIRGYTVASGDVGLNGLYGMASANRMPTVMMERVEVLKGPGTLMYGIGPNGSIGGAINIVTKRAGDEPLTRLTGTFQSKSQLGVQADVGRRFGENKEWGVRVNGAYQNGKTTLDDGRAEQTVGAIGLDYRGSKLRWSLDAYTQHEGIDNFRPQIGFQAGVTSIPEAPSGHRNFYPGTKLNLHDTAVMSRLEYDVAPNLMLWGAAGYHEGSTYQDFPSGRVDSLGNFMVNNALYDAYSKTRTAEVGARASFATWDVGHTVTFSATRLEQEAGNFYGENALSDRRPSNLYNPVPIPPAYAVRGEPQRASETELTSFSLTDTLSFANDRVLLTGGLRHQRVALQNFTSGGVQSGNYDDSAVSPLAGIVIKPLSNVSVYGNYTAGLTRGGVAPAGTRNAGEVFAPYKSKQYEAGVKVDWSQRVTTTVSVFQIERPSAVTDPATNIYSFDGEQRNRGLELSAYGEVMRGLRLMASATFFDARLTQTAGGANDGNDANGVPRRAFNLGVDWDMPWVPGLSLSGRVLHTSSMYFNAANTLSLPSYTRYDVGARYRTRIGTTPVVLRANVLNLFNDNYWLVSGTYVTAAAPRTLMLSAQFDF